MALYLKYRPHDFSSLVGQKFIKETLQKAVADNKTVGAYLFTGPRGTGKTSSARIFAKAINCENPKDGNPCGECNICKSFSENSLIDIIEIDAASHTGVDNIREIIEKAQFRPTSTKYKIYIIDEVHMLSKGAFNALLKILEEPPEHVKFILATTEIHKVPETILSRCQRYDFRNHSDEDVKNRLEFIAKEEGVTVDEESYNYIVKSAGGGLRNAISLFEQLIVDDIIAYEAIVATLWIASQDERESFMKKLLANDATALDDFSWLIGEGRNLKNFFIEILSDMQNFSIQNLQSGKDISLELRIMDILQDTLMKTKNSFDETSTLRIGLLKMISGYTPETITPKVTESPKTKKVSADTMRHPSAHMEEVVHKVEEKTGEDLLSGAEDIFASSWPFEDMGGQETPQQGFDSATLIDNTKAAWGKAALIMSLKPSSFSLDGDTLKISTKAKIAYATISKPENKETIITALEKMWIKVENIDVS